jgi:hypothetical protein
VFAGILSDPIAKPVLDDTRVSILVFDAAREAIVQWVP